MKMERINESKFETLSAEKMNLVRGGEKTCISGSGSGTIKNSDGSVRYAYSSDARYNDGTATYSAADTKFECADHY